MVVAEAALNLNPNPNAREASELVEDAAVLELEGRISGPSDSLASSSSRNLFLSNRTVNSNSES